MPQAQEAGARWGLICELSSSLLDSPKSEWNSILDRECGTDSDLREQALAVCGNYSESDDFFGSPVVSPLTLEDSLIGKRIGAWNVLRILGEGGMGRVYLVERADGVFTQMAALKVIRDQSDPASILRFQAERRILAMLEHPSITRAIDGGSTPNGSPYVVMEYVEGGKPIDEYCGQSNVKDKVRLFLQVVEGVAEAHKQNTAHRDLKPANILVGFAGVPKILDFGIAKIFKEAMQSPEQTLAAHAALTPNYASPEQLLREPSSLLSDVYSLGAVLYAILTGQPPHDLTGLNFLRSVQLVTESDPAPPSTRNQAIDTEVDAIVMKAMERSPANRYRSAAEFAEDLRRYCEGVPVKARQRTLTVRASRLIRRSPWIGWAAACGLLLAFAAATSATLGWRAESQRLDHLSKTARPIISEYQSQLASLSGSPLQLDRIASGEKSYLDRMNEDAAKDPDLRRLFASAYGSLASYPLLDKFAIEDCLIKSTSHWRAVEKRESRSADRLEMAGAWRRLGAIRTDMGKLSESGRLLDHALVLLDSLSETPQQEAGKQERVITLLEFSRLSARVGDARGAIEYGKKALAEQKVLSAKSAAGHGSDEHTFELAVKQGNSVWKESFRAASASLKQHATFSQTKNGGGPVAFSFQINSTSNNAPSSQISLTGTKPGFSGEPPRCAENVVGVYQWTTDNRISGRGNGKLEQVGFVKLTADHVAVTQTGAPLRDGRPGVWHITNDCLVTINWQNGRFIDVLTLSDDGKRLTGTSQIGTIITGTK
jgi:serine/threonine protein kinase